MINIAIVEDEKKYQELLVSYFDRYNAEKGEKFHVVCYGNPVDFLSGYTPNFDIVLMDIELPDFNGIEASRKLRQLDNTVALIFVTNMAQFAVIGYEVNAFDYIVKPVSYYDFALKLERTIVKLKSENSFKINITVNDMVMCINTADLKYIEVTGHNLIFHTTGGNYSTTGKLKAYEQKLSELGFARCNNCYLVNLRYVTAIKGFTVTVDGEELLISHPKRKDFRRALNEYLGEKL